MAALRVGDIDFLRRRIELHRNAVVLGQQTFVGTLKSNKNRTVVLPRFVIDALAQTAEGKDRDELLRPSQTGSYLAPPSSHESWLSGAVRRCQKSDQSFPGSPPTDYATLRRRWPSAPMRIRRWSSACSGTPVRR
jgi:integrase